MIEKRYAFKLTNEKIIEMIVDDAHVHLNHMVLTTGSDVPKHFTNSNVYMIVVRGTMTIYLGEQPPHTYSKGDILNIPYHTKMHVVNQHEDVLEFFVVKSPNPKDYKGQ